jgi:hypothetical protein
MRTCSLEYAVGKVAVVVKMRNNDTKIIEKQCRQNGLWAVSNWSGNQ